MHRRRPGHRDGRRARQLSTAPGDIVARDLFLHWLKHAHARTFRAADSSIATDGEFQMEVHTRPVITSEDSAWDRTRSLLEELIGEDLPVRAALWVPSGAPVPSDEPALSEFVSLVRQAAIRLGPGERSHVRLPITLRLRKSSESGGVISVTGGLNPHWASFTGRVQGTFDLDTTDLYRLPESDEHRIGLIDYIVDRANGLGVGDIAIIETTDHWTIHRLEGESSFQIVGVPPDAAVDMGLAVRRNLKQILKDEGGSLRESADRLTALVLVAPYARIEQEGITTALRGYDPGLYSGIDFIALASDGVNKPLVQPPASALPWTARSTV